MIPTAEDLTALLVLRYLRNKKALHSSHALYRLFSAVGVYSVGVPQLLARLEADGLIRHDGPFDATSGLLKNLTLTDAGLRAAESAPLEAHAEALNQEFSGYEKYQDFFQ